MGEQTHNSLTLLSVWAHPDDESFGPAGLFAQLHTQNVRLVMITATHGERGDAGDPALDSPTILSEIRAQELAHACEIIGIDRLELWDYADGGLNKLDGPELRDRIVAVMNEEKPDLVLTFGPDGMYGHPDHMAIHVATTQAFAQYIALHSDQEPPRLYYMTLGGKQTITNAAGGEHPDPLAVTTVLDVSEFVDCKRQALQAHATQARDWSQYIDNPEWMNVVYLHRAYPPYPISDQVETILFADFRS